MRTFDEKDKQRNGGGPCGNIELRFTYLPFFLFFFRGEILQHVCRIGGNYSEKEMVLVKKGKTAEQISDKVRKDKGPRSTGER